MSSTMFFGVLVVVITAVSAFPAAVPTGHFMYYQQISPAFQTQYRPYYQPYQPATVYRPSNRRSTAEEFAANDEASFVQDDAPLILGDGEIAVGSAADTAASFADEPSYQDEVAPSFQNDLELVQNDEESFADEPAVAAPVKPARRPSNSSIGSVPHTFFAMNFGNLGRSSVAVANSYSTGKGSAVSHAVAHGSSNGASKQRTA